MKRIVVSLMLVGFLFVSSNAIKGQDIRNKALFLYNFTKHVGWPPDVKMGDFVIGVIGDNSIYNKTKEITTGRMAGNQKIVVKKFNSVDEITYCHILFVSNGQSGLKNMEKIMDKIGNKSTLVVTEQDGAINRGSGINFIIQDNLMKFQLSKTNTTERRLQISLNLEKLAIVV